MKAAMHLENLAPKDESKGYGKISAQTGIILMDEPNNWFVDSVDCDKRIMVTGFHVCCVPKWKSKIIMRIIGFNFKMNKIRLIVSVMLIVLVMTAYHYDPTILFHTDPWWLWY